MYENKKFTIIGAISVIIAIIFTVAIWNYNVLVTIEEKVNLQYSQIETNLQRRADLIPQLVETVKGYSKHEEKVFTEIANAREQLTSSLSTGDINNIAESNEELTVALNKFLAIAEAYPELKANDQYIALMDEIAGCENRIAVSRQYYNEAVQKYNLRIRRYPANIFANFLGFEQRDYFKADDSASSAPEINFD